jgi:hypothetical protein
MFVTVNSLLCATLLKFPVFLPVFHSFMCKCVITIKTIGVQVGPWFAFSTSIPMSSSVH